MLLQEVWDFFAAELADGSSKGKVPRVGSIVVNSGFTGVLLENGQAGVAMNIRGGANANPLGLQLLHNMIGQNALQVAQNAIKSTAGNHSSGRLLLTSVGVAALSALSQPYLNDETLAPWGLTVRNSGFSRILEEAIPAGSTVGMVGFGGAVLTVAKRAGEVVVTELEPRLFSSFIVREQGITLGPTRVRLLQAEAGEKYLPANDTVLITGCTLVSQTLDALLDACRGTRVIVYGPSASIFPLPLFRRPQVAMVTTMHITDGPALMDLLADGGPAVERFFSQVGEDLTIERAAPPRG